MGEIANSRGDLNGALSRYNEAFASTQELLRRSPDDPKRLFDHAQNVFWVGQIAWQRGQIPQAERSIREYLRLAEHMMALDPANEKYRLERKYAKTSLGAILIDLRRYGKRRRYSARRSTTRKPLPLRHPVTPLIRRVGWRRWPGSPKRWRMGSARRCAGAA